MSIWDNVRKSQPTDAAVGGGRQFILQYGTEQMNLPCDGRPLSSLMKEHGSFLGYDGGRQVTWRTGDAVVADSTIPEAGRVYMASVSLETKGA